MTGYKLTYFNGRGRAEIVRLVFAAAGVEYQDIRIEKANWPALKPTTPFGQVPVLEADGGLKLCQSNSIARYLARKFHLAGKTDEDQARADMVVDCFEDTMKPVVTFLFESDETRMETLKKKALEEQLPTSLAGLEGLLKANHGGDGFFVGTELTWADLGFIVFVGWLSMAGADTQLAKYPKLTALRERVEKVPKVAAWLAKRPVTEF
jgi:glutathione S-transferase